MISKVARTAWIAALAAALPVLVADDLFGYRAVLLSRHGPPGYLFSEALSRLGAVPRWLVVATGLLGAAGVGLGIGRLSRSLSTAGKSRRRLETVLALGAAAASAGLILLYREEILPQEISGLAAVGAAAVLMVSLLPLPARALGIASLAVPVALVAAVCVPRLHPEHRVEVASIHGALDRAEAELEARRDGWQRIDALRAETAARQRGERAGVFRFEERLSDLVAVEAPPRDASSGVLYSFPRDGGLSAAHGAVAARIENGALVIPEYPAGTYLSHPEALGIDAERVGSLVVSMTVSAGSYFELYWSDTDRRDFHDGIRVPLGQPGKPSSYQIAESLIRFRERGTLNRIWIMPSDRDARIEIGELRILDRTAALGGAPFAAGYENVGDEIRRVLLTASPSTLTWKVPVPARRPRMRLGLAAADPGVAVTFEVRVGEDAQAILTETIGHPASWRDFELDLSPWAGEETRIALSTASFAPGVGLWSHPVVFGERTASPNVVVYLVDCLRARSLGAYGYDRETSAVFDRLAAHGTLFENAYSNGTTTKLSVPGLFTSNPISATGVRYSPDVLPAGFPTLAELLRGSGYATAAFATNANVGPFSGTHRGFSRLYTAPRMAAAAGYPPGSVDIETVVAPLLDAWLEENRERNFFLYVHTLDAHAPYDPPAPYRAFFEALRGGSPVARDPFYDPQWLAAPTAESRQALYDGELAYGDEHFGRFLDKLWESSERQRTVFVFTADHGEYFGEHGKFGHSPPAFVQGVHVPLLLVGPGIPAGRRVAEPVQLMDILPTLLDALGWEGDRLLFQGRSFLPLARGEDRAAFLDRAIYIEGELPDEVSVRLGRFHYIPEKNLWLDLGDDPLERRPWSSWSLAFAVKSRARALGRRYREVYWALHEKLAPEGAGALDVDPETLEQLRSLGYID